MNLHPLYSIVGISSYLLLHVGRSDLMSVNNDRQNRGALALFGELKYNYLLIIILSSNPKYFGGLYYNLSLINSNFYNNK
jgi:hypothetical protein